LNLERNLVLFFFYLYKHPKTLITRHNKIDVIFSFPYFYLPSPNTVYKVDDCNKSLLTWNVPFYVHNILFYYPICCWCCARLCI